MTSENPDVSLANVRRMKLREFFWHAARAKQVWAMVSMRMGPVADT